MGESEILSLHLHNPVMYWYDWFKGCRDKNVIPTKKVKNVKSHENTKQ